MKIIFTKVLMVFCFLFYAFGALNAQNTYVQIHVESALVDWDIDAVLAADWGNGIPVDGLTAQLIAVVDTSETDSVGIYGCDSMFVNGEDLIGNIALISRGDCEFGRKALNAEGHGAVAVIIGNRSPIGYVIGGSAVGVINMAAGVSGALVTIPSMSVNYEDQRALRLLLEQGPVTITLKAPAMYDAAASYAYATPLSQARPLDDLVVAFQNLGDTTYNGTVYVDITDPSGNVTTFSETIDTLVGNASVIASGGEVVVNFDDTYTPTEVGEYNVRYYIATEDEVHPLNTQETSTHFFITEEYTMQVDNGEVANPVGLALYNQAYTDDGSSYGLGVFYRSGPEGGNATYVSFGISNPEELEDGLEFFVNIYNADEDANSIADVALGVPINITSYVFEKDAVEANVPITVELDEVLEMAPNGYYLVIIDNDGSSADNFVCPGLTAAGGFVVPSFKSVVRTDSVYEIDGFEAWNDGTNADSYTFAHGGRSPWIRLHLDGFTVVNTDLPQLAKNEISVFPSPADEVVNLVFDLEQATGKAELVIADFNGRMIKSFTLEDMQNGSVPIDVRGMASGTYFVQVTTEFGYRTKSFVVGH